jgi:carbonic anhydrase
MAADNTPDQALERLLAGVHQFRRDVYPRRKTIYQRLMREGQHPHTLFITCADSRIAPELLTQSGPGDLFVLRNIGNLVPPYGEMMGGVSAVIEYAVVALEVNQIVICGHSECGAMKGLLSDRSVASMPAVKNWLRNADAALSVVRARNLATDENARLDELVEQNVLMQMNHALTHPSVAAAVAAGTLAVTGWVYDIAPGDVRLYNQSKKQFVALGDAARSSAVVHS